MTQHVAHRASDHIRELNAEIERLEDQRNNLQAKVNEQAAEIERALASVSDLAIQVVDLQAERAQLRKELKTIIACLKESQGGWLDDWFVTIEVAELLLRKGASA